MQTSPPEKQAGTDSEAASLPDYRHDAEAYELEEHARPDEMLMLAAAADAANTYLATMKDARCLDLCCGTGLSMKVFVDHPRVAAIVGIDNSPEYLHFAKTVFRGARALPGLVLGDAVDTDLSIGSWDLIMLASAYHHIEDERKLQFLTRVKALLSADGRALLAENIIPPYVRGDRNSYSQSVSRFYTAVLNTARKRNPDLPPIVEQLIQRVAKYGYDGEYEYKVSLDILQDHIARAGLIVESMVRVWPQDDGLLGSTAGNYVMVLR